MKASCDMLTMALRLAGAYGGCRRLGGSTATVQMYRVVILGVLCSQILLASLDRTPYEVNTFTSNRRILRLRSAYNSTELEPGMTENESWP